MPRICRVGTIPTKKYPGAGQSVAELHQRIENSFLFAVKEPDDQFQAIYKNVYEVSWRNVRAQRDKPIRNIFLMICRTLKLIIINFKLFSKFNKLRPDIIHVHSAMYSLAALFMKLIFPKIKVFLTIHGSEKDFLTRHSFFSRLILARFNGILFVTRSDQNLFDKYKLNENNCYVGNGYNANLFNIDKENLSKKFSDFSKIFITIIGSLRHQKNQSLLLESFAQLSDSMKKRIQISIIGDGPDRANLQKKVDDLNLQKHCFLHGSMPIAKVKEFLEQAHFIAITSTTEGFPKVALEAGSMGVIPIHTDVGEMQYLYNPHSFKIDDLTVDSFRDALINISNLSSQEALKRSKKLREIAIKYTWEKHLKLTLKHYENL